MNGPMLYLPDVPLWLAAAGVAAWALSMLAIVLTHVEAETRSRLLFALAVVALVATATITAAEQPIMSGCSMCKQYEPGSFVWYVMGCWSC